MKATLVAPDPAAVTHALIHRGEEVSPARATALGLQPVVLFLDRLDASSTDAVARVALENHLEYLTGDGWILLAGSAAKLGALGRPGASSLPSDVAEAVGNAIAPVMEPVDAWLVAGTTVSLEQPLIAGILNVTPDSFSDGGRLDPDIAVEHAVAMVEEGATIVDIGAESTRPGRPDPVSLEEEWRRLSPVVGGVAARLPGTLVSVDTVKAEIARRALEGGAAVINDVSGLRHDPAIADRCAEAGAGLILMHSRGDVSTMATYDHAEYTNVAGETANELDAARDRALERGVERARIILDPGFGFSKTPEQTYDVFRHLPTIVSLGQPVMVGPSRKRFLGAATGRDVLERDVASAAACAAAYLLGAHIFRVHAVGPTRDALNVAAALRGA